MIRRSGVTPADSSPSDDYREFPQCKKLLLSFQNHYTNVACMDVEVLAICRHKKQSQGNGEA